jgi:hypothetical protein
MERKSSFGEGLYFRVFAIENPYQSSIEDVDFNEMERKSF